jgi:hypothetical protein
VCEYCRWTSEDYTAPTKDASSSSSTAAASSSAAAAKSPLLVGESNLLSARIKEAEQSASIHASFHTLLSHYRTRSSRLLAASKRTGSLALLTPPDPKLFDEWESLLAGQEAMNPLTGGAGAGAAGAATGGAKRRVGSISSGEGVITQADASNVGRWMAWRAQREQMMHKAQYVLPEQPVVNQFEPIPIAFLGHFDDGQSVEDRQGHTHGMQCALESHRV